jgi:spermidine/putrescine-binding protein
MVMSRLFIYFLISPRSIRLICTLLMIFNTIFVCAQENNKKTETLSLRLLVWEGYAPVKDQTAFIEDVYNKYNVKLKFVIKNASNPDDFFNELRKGTVEMVSPAHNLPKDSLYNLTTNGLTLPINLTNIPNYRYITKDLQYKTWAIEGDQVFAIPVLQGPYGLAYNSDIIKEEPTSWNILWDPRYQRRYMVSGDYYELNIYISALVLGYKPEDIFSYDIIKGQLLEEQVRKLAVNAHSFWRGFDNAIHFKGKALATTWRSAFPSLNALGEKWRISVPREGTTWWVDTLMISHTLSANPVLKRIAEEWINYLLVPKVQAESLALQLGVYPVTTPALALFQEKRSLSSDIINQNRLLENHIPWKVLKTRSRNAFNLLWSDALRFRTEKNRGNWKLRIEKIEGSSQ